MDRPEAQVPAAGPHLPGEAAKRSSIDVSVVVPVLNERQNIDRCCAEIIRALEAAKLTFEIVFVDDGSTDGSTERMRELALSDPRICLVRLIYNIGQQRAMYSALRHCRGDAVITYDADLQFDPECLPVLTRKIQEGYSIAGGVRAARRDSLLLNRIPSRIGGALISRALGVRQQDFGGVKAYSAALVRALLATPTPQIVIPAMAYSISRNAIEVPVKHAARKAGRSKWSVLRRIELYLDVYTLYAKRPFTVAVALGWLMMLAGAALGAGLLVYRLAVSAQFSGLIIFFDLFLIAAGFHFVVLAIIGEFVVRLLRSSRAPLPEVVAEVVRADSSTALTGAVSSVVR